MLDTVLSGGVAFGLLGWLAARVAESGVPQVPAATECLALLALSLLVLRWATVGRRRDRLAGEHVLHLGALNSTRLVKELFLAYLNAALLEPVLAIVGMERAAGPQLSINVATLGAIFWWIWLLTDAFDYADVAQQFKYREFRKEAAGAATPPAWLQLDSPGTGAAKLKARLANGSWAKDVALWCVIATVAAAWVPGSGVTHRDALHAYAVLVFWAVLHHQCRSATHWGASYPASLLLPSVTLMPLEFCLPLGDVMDCVEDVESLGEWRDFIAARTGVRLILRS